eukprot:m.228580 g.228580  ORF g.228580 m.228580 type:complete len:689 (+) comp25978_c0_seq1:1127-3193(+)
MHSLPCRPLWIMIRPTPSLCQICIVVVVLAAITVTTSLDSASGLDTPVQTAHATVRLQRAILEGDTATAHTLIREGVPHSVMAGAQSALMLACYRGDATTVDLLLNAGAASGARHTADKFGRGRTALVYAIDGEVERNRRQHGSTPTGPQPDLHRVLTSLLHWQPTADAAAAAGITPPSPAPTDVEPLTPASFWRAAVAAGEGRLKHPLGYLFETCQRTPGCATEMSSGVRTAPILVAILKQHHALHKVVSTYLLRRRGGGPVGNGGIGTIDAFASWGLDIPANGLTTDGSAVDPSVVQPLLLRWAAELVDDVLDACTQLGWDCGRMVEVADPATGDRPLHLAAAIGCADAVQALLRYGADPTAKDTRGRTAAEIAAWNGFPEVGETLHATARANQCAGGETSELPTLPPYGQSGTGATIHCARGDWMDMSTMAEHSEPAKWPSIDNCLGGARVVFASTPTSPQLTTSIVRGGAPVLLRGAAADWPASLEWGGSLSGLAAKYGDQAVAAAAIPYANQFGLPAHRMSLASFVTGTIAAAASVPTTATGDTLLSDADNNYIFDPQFFEHCPDAKATIQTPVLFQGIATGATQFMAGPAGTGAPVHFHKAAWNACVFGRKQWAFFPPNSTFMSAQPVARWWASAATSERVQAAARIVVQEAGDVIFVPSGWGHAVRNLAPSAAVAVELHLS